MKVLTPNHKYELSNCEHPKKPGQVIQFIEKSGGKIVNDGTTVEEVIRVLIDRLRGMGAALFGKEYFVAIQMLEKALPWVDQRMIDSQIKHQWRTYNSLPPNDPEREQVIRELYSLETHQPPK